MLCVHESQRFQVLVIQLQLGCCTTLVHFDCGPAETYPICVIPRSDFAQLAAPNLRLNQLQILQVEFFFFCKGFLLKQKGRGGLEIWKSHEITPSDPTAIP